MESPEVVYEIPSESWAVKVPGRRHLLSDTVAAMSDSGEVRRLGNFASALNLTTLRMRNG